MKLMKDLTIYQCQQIGGGNMLPTFKEALLVGECFGALFTGVVLSDKETTANPIMGAVLGFAVGMALSYPVKFIHESTVNGIKWGWGKLGF
jgi:hypothetical protein